ncbi:hypothetical protein AXF42_Ash019390 [Apostasia shenzhenica]|uniref:SANTA domain-containing protein n=1 Tax=Apostasia shenzhenica TaxID=1088818 RepID=A0A2I0B4T7_9ASPA|nr:hypothetical protein AXF42_Ash019390 [Apostasia shenzhenica]
MPLTNLKLAISCRGESVKIFSSGPIVKRHDAYTVEAADGMVIRILGFINKTRTIDNGFSLEVCRIFLTGFPTTWVNLANESSWSKSSRFEALESASGSAELSANSSKTINFEFPVQSENGNANISPSTPSTPVFGSKTLLDAIQKFVTHLSVPNTAHMASKGQEFCDLPNKAMLDVAAQQDDATIGINMRSDDTIDNASEYHEAGHSEGAGCQTHDVHVDGVGAAKKASRRSNSVKANLRSIMGPNPKKKYSQTTRNIKKAKKAEALKDMEHGEHKESCGSRPEPTRMPNHKDVHNAPLIRSKRKALSISSPETPNLKRSRPGRLLVPPFGSSSEIVSLGAQSRPSTQSKGKALSVSSPMLLNLKRSRSGRLLIPPLDSSSRILYGAVRLQCCFYVSILMLKYFVPLSYIFLMEMSSCCYFIKLFNEGIIHI